MYCDVLLLGVNRERRADKLQLIVSDDFQTSVLALCARFKGKGQNLFGFNLIRC